MLTIKYSLDIKIRLCIISIANSRKETGVEKVVNKIQILQLRRNY